MNDTRLAIIIDGNGQAAVAAFDATTGSMGRMINAAEIVDRQAKVAGKSVADAGDKTEKSGSQADEAAKRWKRLGTAIGLSITTIATGASLLAARAVNTADRIDELSARTSISTETLSGWGYAAKRSGTDLEGLIGGVEKFNRNVALAVDRTSKNGKLFDALGLDAVDKATGKLKTIEQLLPQVADRFKRLEDPALKTALAMQLFGRSGGELVEFLSRGSEGIDELAAHARELGIVLDVETSTAAAGLKDQVEDMQASMLGLATRVMVQLMPTLTEASARMTEWASNGQNVNAVADGVGNSFRFLAGAAEFLGGYLKAADDVVEGLTRQFVGLKYAAENALDGNFDLAKHGLSEYLAGRNQSMFGSEDPVPTAKRPSVNLVDPTALLAEDQRKVAALKAQREESKRLMALLDGDEDRAAKATASAAKKAAREREAELKRQTDSIKRYTDQAAMAAAELDGPLSAATEKHRQKLAELDAQLAKHNLTQDAYQKLVAASTAELDKQTLAVQRRMSAPDTLLEEMRQELQLLGLVGREREVVYRQLQAEADMRKALADAAEAAGSKQKLAEKMGADSYAAYEAQMINAARATAEFSVIVEESVAQAQEWADVWYRGIGSVADAFTDFVMSGLKDFRNFGSSLKSMAKQMVADMVRTYMQQKLVVPIHAEVTGMSGVGGQGGLFGSLASLFGGNGFGAAGQSGGGIMAGIGRLFGAGQQGGIMNRIGSFFGFGSSGAASSSGWGAFAPNVAGFGWGGAGLATGAAGSGGGFGLGGLGSAGSLFGKGTMGRFLTSPAAPWLGAAAGALYGWQKGGDTPGKAAGATAYGVAGYGVMAGVGAGVGAAAAGAGIAGAASAGLAAVPVAGWIALAAIGIDKISGGKLFGTKFKTDSAALQLDFNSDGVSGATTVNESRKKSFFRGTKRRTTTTALDAEAQAAVDEVFAAINTSVSQAAAQLGIVAPELISASFRQEFDGKGNLKKEFGTIAGRVYNEAQEAFTERLLAENLLNVAKAVGNAAEIEKLAGNYRADPSSLTDFATLALAMQSDIQNMAQIWETGADSFERVVSTIERLVQGNESLAETYGRVTTAANSYGSFIADIETQLRTSDLNQYQRAQLDIEMSYRDQVKQANALAKALGLSGARAEDLARIEQLRALNMASLQTQMENDRNNLLSGLSLSEYSPLTDSQKLAEAMAQLQQAVSSGDLNAASSLSQTALGLGRNLYASGRDYNNLYDQVTGMIKDISMPNLATDDGTSMGDLADILQQLPRDFASEMFALLMNPPAPKPTGGTSAPQETNPPPSTGGPGPNGGLSMDTTNNLLNAILEAQKRINSELERKALR